mmetsp:Transcript_5093/g.10408  ORF Transcript_5093/g.10408 Transcript_5093/m.10408 type:complete len:213 (+) Transcript_5093:1691-2329(+)
MAFGPGCPKGPTAATVVTNIRNSLPRQRSRRRRRPPALATLSSPPRTRSQHRQHRLRHGFHRRSQPHPHGQRYRRRFPHGGRHGECRPATPFPSSAPHALPSAGEGDGDGSSGEVESSARGARGGRGSFGASEPTRSRSGIRTASRRFEMVSKRDQRDGWTVHFGGWRVPGRHVEGFDEERKFGWRGRSNEDSQTDQAKGTFLEGFAAQTSK